MAVDFLDLALHQTGAILPAIHVKRIPTIVLFRSGYRLAAIAPEPAPSKKQIADS
jgi:hypothetical protein